jgi:hypothetical protein
MSYLIYVNGLGPNYKGDNLYEFIFSDSLDVWGDSWESRPANGYPSPPELHHIKKVGVLRNTDVKLELIQNSDFFSIWNVRTTNKRQTLRKRFDIRIRKKSSL